MMRVENNFELVNVCKENYRKIVFENSYLLKRLFWLEKLG